MHRLILARGSRFLPQQPQHRRQRLKCYWRQFRPMLSHRPCPQHHFAGRLFHSAQACQFRCHNYRHTRWCYFSPSCYRYCHCACGYRLPRYRHQPSYCHCRCSACRWHYPTCHHQSATVPQNPRHRRYRQRQRQHLDLKYSWLCQREHRHRSALTGPPHCRSAPEPYSGSQWWSNQYPRQHRHLQPPHLPPLAW